MCAKDKGSAQFWLTGRKPSSLTVKKIVPGKSNEESVVRRP